MLAVKFQNITRNILLCRNIVSRNKNILSSNRFCGCREVFPVNKFRTKNVQQFCKYATSRTIEQVDHNVFDKVCEETLESLTEFFEELIESCDKFKAGDVSYSGGVLTIHLGPKYGTYVINRQSPNKQIWLSSPTSGPKRYDLVGNGTHWIYKHDGQTLHKLLENEFSEIVGETVNLKFCAYWKV